MTQEEALKVVKSATVYTPKEMEALETLIPGFSQSEDDRILNALITHIRIYEGDFTTVGITRSEILDYLEKLKEQKPISFNEPYNPDDYEVVMEGNATGLKRKEQKPLTAKEYHDKFDKMYEQYKPNLVEQKPAEWKPQSEALEALKYAIEGKWEMIKPTSYLSRRLEDLYEELVNNFNVDETLIADKDIEELKAMKAEIEASMEQKPAEKQDYSGLNDLERAILRGFLAAGVENVPVGIIKETAQECLAQMKPAEWSEEDEDMLNSCISSIEEAKENRYAYKETDGDTSYDHEIDWLKSLRPQPKREIEICPHSVKSKSYSETGYPIKDCDYGLEIAADILRKTRGKVQGYQSDDGLREHDTAIAAVENADKFLRPHWKPSEEQMEAFRSYIKDFQEKAEVAVGGWNNFDVMIRLFEQLKAL